MAADYSEGGYDYLFKVILLGDVDSRKLDLLCTYTGEGKDRTLGKNRFDSLARHGASLGFSISTNAVAFVPLYLLNPSLLVRRSLLERSIYRFQLYPLH